MSDKNNIGLSTRRGFTLLELLVVVAIIAFLSSVSVVALTASQQASRDKTRKLDQLTIIKAAELYSNDFGAPPTQFIPVTTMRSIERSVASDKSNLSNKLFGIPIANALTKYYITEDLCLNDFGSCYHTSGPGGSGGGWVGVTGGAAVCGNGTWEHPQGEVCDPTDPTMLNGIGCKEDGPPQNRCTPYPGWECEPLLGGCATVCSDGIVAVGGPEECDDGNLDNGDGCSSSCLIEAVVPGAPANPCGNGTCEPNLGENLSSCTADCVAGGATPVTCDNDTFCEAGENPGNCRTDCLNYSMCYAGGNWDLCCLFGGAYCTQGGGSSTGGGYYGVCNYARCEQKYLLQRPAFTCTTDSQCAPTATTENKFVKDTDSTKWLKGLEKYIPRIPRDPGHHTNPAYNVYYASSHPDIVGRHKFCVWVSLERINDNFNSYSDLTETPTGPLDPLWTPLCSQ